MRSFSTRGRVVVMSSLLAAWTVLGFACSVEEENPATTRARGTDSGTDSTAAATADGASTVDPAVCGKLGNYDGVKAVAQQIISAAKADCRIGPVVSNAENDDAAHFNECFQIFLGGGVRCPGITYEDGKTVDSKNKKCNQILPGLKFSSMDYKAFADFNAKPNSVVKAVLDSKGLSADDFRAIASLFEGKKASLLDGDNNDVPQNKYTQCAPNCAAGGEACVPLIIDAGKDNNTPPVDAGNDASDADAN